MSKRRKKRKLVQDMTRAELLAVPSRRSFDYKMRPFDSLVLIPQRRLHDSGYRVFTAVACRWCVPFCKVTECSDDLNLDPRSRAWRLDFLPKTGFAHVWVDEGMNVSAALSSFHVRALG